MSTEKLGRFRIEGLLGQGGMGAVYAATDPDSGDAVALKVLSSGLSDDDGKFRRFEQEVSALSRLDHPNIVRLLGPLERDGDRTFFAMERLSGEPLSAVLRREGPLPVSTALEIARCLFTALAAAHAAGVIHRDVKPSNIVIDGERVILTDFGLARMEDITRLTMTGQLMGTLDYMSPEQCEGTGVDQRSDLYSAGIVLYEMLAGAPPFRHTSPGAVLRGHLATPPPGLDGIRADLPPGLAEVVDRLLEKDPDRRYASARAALDELDRIEAPASTVTFRRGRAPAGGPEGGTRRRRSLALYGVAIALAGALVFLVARHGPGEGGASSPADTETIEATLATIHRAIRTRDYPLFADCFLPGALFPWFGSDLAAEFEARVAKATDFAYRAEIPLRGATQGEDPVRMVSGAALPIALGLDPGMPLRLVFWSGPAGWRVRLVERARGGPRFGGPGPPRGGGERRMLRPLVAAWFHGMPERGIAPLRELAAPADRGPELDERLTAFLAKGTPAWEPVEGEARIGPGNVATVVRVPGLATALGRTDDRFDLVFGRSAENPTGFSVREFRVHVE